MTDQDIVTLKEALVHLFDDDISSARPVGTMNVEQLYWWDHSAEICKMPKVSAQQMYDSVIIKEKNPDQLPKSLEDYIISHVNYRRFVKPDIYFNKAPETWCEPKWN